MPLSWDLRVVPAAFLEFVKAVQGTSSCRLSGGAALSGVHLRHRLSNDLDLFCDDRQNVREVLRACSDIAAQEGGEFRLIRDGGSFIRGRLSLRGQTIEVNLAHEPSIPLAPRDVVEGVIVDSLSDMHANKITCLLSRSEPRDLVDLYFLDRAHRRPEDHLMDALAKDAGVDPGILSGRPGLLNRHPVRRCVMAKSAAKHTCARMSLRLAGRGGRRFFRWYDRQSGELADPPITCALLVSSPSHFERRRTRTCMALTKRRTDT